MTARRAVLAGLATLGARPAALGAALFAGATASVALRAATAASEALRLHGAWGAALLAWLLGTLLGTLLSGAALAAALGAPTAHQAPRGVCGVGPRSRCWRVSWPLERRRISWRC